MDRGLLGISEFFLRHRYNYICEAIGLRNPSAPSRSIRSELPEHDYWKDLHLSARELSLERQHVTVSAADATADMASRPDANSIQPAAAEGAHVFSSFQRALSELRSKETFLTRASRAPDTAPSRSPGIKGTQDHAVCRLGERTHAHLEEHDDAGQAVLPAQLDEPGGPGLQLEARGDAVIVRAVRPGSSASRSSHPILLGDEVIGVNGVDVRGHGTAYVELQLTGPAFSPVVVTFLPGPDSRAYYQDVYRKVMSCSMQLYSGDKRYEEVFRLAAMDPGGAGRVVKINPWLAGPYYTVSLVRDTPESLQDANRPSTLHSRKQIPLSRIPKSEFANFLYGREATGVLSGVKNVHITSKDGHTSSKTADQQMLVVAKVAKEEPAELEPEMVVGINGISPSIGLRVQMRQGFLPRGVGSVIAINESRGYVAVQWDDFTETSCAYVAGGDQTLFIIDAAGVHHKGEYHLCQYEKVSTNDKKENADGDNAADETLSSDDEKILERARPPESFDSRSSSSSSQPQSQESQAREWNCDLNMCQNNSNAADRGGIPQSVKMLGALPLIPGPWSHP